MFVAKIEARAYARVTELQERVETAILNLFPERLREEVEIISSKAEGHSGDRIQIIEAKLTHKTSCDATLDYIFQSFDKRDLMRLKNSLLRRLNENCLFFLRIDKQAAFMGRLALADGPDIISVKVDIRNQPKCTQNDAKVMLEERLHVAGGEN